MNATIDIRTTLEHFLETFRTDEISEDDIKEEVASVRQEKLNQ